MVLFWGDEKPEELEEGLERPVGGIKWLICILEILVLSGRNQLIISFRPRFLLGKTGLVQVQILLFKLRLERVHDTWEKPCRMILQQPLFI